MDLMLFNEMNALHIRVLKRGVAEWSVLFR